MPPASGEELTFYNGKSFAEAPTISDVAAHGIFTRAVIADIPALRGTDWVEAGSPVEADEIDEALAAVQVESGDALALYMGRDRFEDQSEDPGAELAGLLTSNSPCPGVRRASEHGSPTGTSRFSHGISSTFLAEVSPPGACTVCSGRSAFCSSTAATSPARRESGGQRQGRRRRSSSCHLPRTAPVAW